MVQEDYNDSDKELNENDGKENWEEDLDEILEEERYVTLVKKLVPATIKDLKWNWDTEKERIFRLQK